MTAQNSAEHLLELFNRVHNLRDPVLVTNIIQGKDGKNMATTTPVRAAVHYNIKNAYGEFDNELAEEFIDNSRIEEIKKIFIITKSILKKMNTEPNDDKTGKKVSDKDFKKYMDDCKFIQDDDFYGMYEWSYNILLALDIISPEMSVGFHAIKDESGILHGVQQIPRKNMNDVFDQDVEEEVNEN